MKHLITGSIPLVGFILAALLLAPFACANPPTKTPTTNPYIHVDSQPKSPGICIGGTCRIRS